MDILLADDHVLFRDALMQFFQSLCPGWTIICTSDFNEAYATLENKTSFDLVLLDLRMPGMNGLDGLQKICDNHPKQPVAILSGVAEEHHVQQAMKIGARAYFPKTLSGKALVKAIEYVVNSGQRFIPMDEKGIKIMPSYYDDHGDITAPEKQTSQDILNMLTKREKQVFHYIAQALSNKEIAREMDIEVSTIKLHVGNVCKKLKAENRTQIAIMAHQHGLIETTHI